MRIAFEKWQGTGNDFILVDDRPGALPDTDGVLARRLCHRHLGIGSDGLVLVRAPHAAGTDFHMEFLNPDGSRSFCGNGSRCAFAFWSALGAGAERARFTAIDGEHRADWHRGQPRITLRATGAVERLGEGMDLLHTGSPHLLIWVDDPEAIDLVPAARAHRYGPRFAREGVNVNFARWHEGRVEMRTYERGVEAETLSCGTGVTAAAIAAAARGLAAPGLVQVRTRGGNLAVNLRELPSGQVELTGPAQRVFTGWIEA